MILLKFFFKKSNQKSQNTVKIHKMTATELINSLNFSDLSDKRNRKLENFKYDEIDINPSHVPVNVNLNGPIYIHNIENRNNVVKYEKSILNDLKHIPIAENIKTTANNIYIEMKVNTRRKTPRNKLLYFCVSTAYKIHGIPYIPGIVADYFNLSMTDLPNANAMYSKTVTGYTVPIPNFTPIDYIHILYKYIGLTPENEKILIDMGNVIISKDEDLLDDFPQDIAAGIILCFMDIVGLEYTTNDYYKISGVGINEQVFADILKKSPKSLKIIKNRIVNIYNS